MNKKIKLFDPVINNREIQEIQKVIKSKFWASGVGGNLVKKFENKFKNYIKTKEVVAVNSGTAALHLALSLTNIKNKEVILPSLSFVSTANAVLYNGGKPVFVDVDPISLCIDPNQVEKKISKQTKIILPVHFAGLPSNLKKLKKMGRNYNITLIEDAAHACGSKFEGKKIGVHGDLVCFSFHPAKNLAMPSGGLIAINSPNFKIIKKILNAKRWCGITDRKDVNYDVKDLGWNFYMNEFSASIGLVQLKKLDKLNKKRRTNVKRYHSEINLESKMLYDNDCSYHFYWILVKNRNELRKKLLRNNIEVGTHYKPIHQMSFYKNKSKLPVTEKVGNEIVTLPTHPNLSNKDLDRIISLVNKYAR